MAKILIVDDEESVRTALKRVFEYEGHQVKLAPNGPSALVDYPGFRPDMTFLDVKMQGMDGLDVLARIREDDPGAPVVMVSGHGTIGTAVEATRRGAFDFLEKPLDTDRLLVTVRNALMVRGLSESVERLKQEVEIRHQIVGGSAAIRDVLERIEKVAPTSARVLITGENGTGKELAARALHHLSPRVKRPFVEVNCAAIPSELIESELFGHVKGSFTGAVADHAGKFEQAHGGTLFLDEIGDMSLSAQAKVLRSLEEGRVTRVGGSKPVVVDVRVVAATNKVLEEAIPAGEFREDLFYRLNVVPIRMPSLRRRKEDVPMLVAHFVDLTAKTGGVQGKDFSPEALAALAKLDWPGNVRELKNTVERLLILCGGQTVEPDDVALLAPPEGGVDAVGGLFSLDTIGEFSQVAEKEFIARKLQDNEWNVSKTARLIGMPRSNLYKKIDHHGLRRS